MLDRGSIVYRILAPAIAVLSGIWLAVTYALDARDIAALGIESDYWRAIAVLVLLVSIAAILIGHQRTVEQKLAGASASMRPTPAAPSTALDAGSNTRLTYFPDRDALDAAGGLVDEVKNAHSVWLAVYVGMFIANSPSLLRSGSIRRLLTLDPEGSFLKRYAEVDGPNGTDLVTLQHEIHSATKEAEANRVEVRWFNGPLLNCVIADDRWARMEIYMPFNKTRQNVRIQKSDYPDLFTDVKSVYERMWADARLPSPLPRPDEQLVILCNSFLTPAFDSLRSVLRDVTDQCFKGGWPGLSARYFRDFAFEPLERNSSAQLEASLNGEGSDLEGAFLLSMEAYLLAVAFVRHCGHLGFFADWAKIGDWVAKDDALQSHIKVLSGGLNRQKLKDLLSFEWERLAMPHEVLEMASK